jgi:hypothetical protein
VKVLVDACMAGSVAPALIESGHDVECVVDWPSDPGDAEILAHVLGCVQRTRRHHSMSSCSILHPNCDVSCDVTRRKRPIVTPICRLLA